VPRVPIRRVALASGKSMVMAARNQQGANALR
jgi:hypothetical protein